MAALERIRTQGFRRWYERQLIEAHLWLLAWFLGVIALASGIEVAGHGRASLVSGALLVLAGLALTLYSWRRYRLLLEIAERLGEQAACPACRAYAKFKVRAAGPAPLPDGGDLSLAERGGELWLRVECSKCGEQWMLR